MSFDTFGRYVGNHKTYDHFGNIIPDVEHSEGERPAFEFKPASWLPVKFFDKHFENWIVVMPGKLVALDPDGYVMPAEYGLTSATVTYTANDVLAGTIDVATGLPVESAKTVTLSQLSGVRQSGWTKALAGVSGQKTSGFMGKFGVAFGDATVKYPIGVAPYAYLQWAGGDGSNPTGYKYHNYNMQHQVAVLCDYVLKLPLIPAAVTAETVDKSATASAVVFGSAAVHTRANAQANATGRYVAATGNMPVKATQPVIALALANFPIAPNTMRTQITLASTVEADDVSDILVNEVSALTALTAAGDFFVDADVGVIFIYSSDGATLPASLSGASGTVSIQYFRLDTAPSVLSQFACVLAGSLQPGDFLKAGLGSNWVVATAASDGPAIVGQVLGFEKFPRDYLERVKTAYSPALQTNSSGAMANGVAATATVGLGQMDQMPGTATGGVSDLVHYSGAADTLVIVNLIGR